MYIDVIAFLVLYPLGAFVMSALLLLCMFALLPFAMLALKIKDCLFGKNKKDFS